MLNADTAEVKMNIVNESDSVNGKEGFLSVKASEIPSILKEKNHWVVWRGVWKPEKNKFDKQPYQTDGNPAKTNDASTWTDFDTVLEYYNFNAGLKADGIGFVLSESLNIAGFDFDHCLDNSGNISDPKVREFVETLSSYTEISPSGKGLRVFAFGKLPDDGRKKGGYECYSSGRYLTLTGHRLPGFPEIIEHREKEIADVHHKIFAKSDKKAEKSKASLSDAQIAGRLKKAFDSKNGDKIRALYEGKWQDCGYSSQSNADLALCSSLAFWLDADPAVMNSAFQKSKLYRDKWNEKHGDKTYGEMTVAKAVEGCDQTYQDTAKENRQTAGSALIEIGRRADLFFCNDEPYATVSVNGHFETHALNSRAFRDYLNGLYYDENGCAANKDGISQAIDNLRAIARKNGEKSVFVRIARVNDTIYVDLCNPEYEVVRITGEGWAVVKEPSVRFIRGTGAEPLPKPERTGTGFDDLKKLMNCKADEDFCMLTGFLIGCFSFGNPYPILCLQGEARSGKSTKTKMIKRLTDPNKADLRALPKEMRDLMISAKHNHTLAYDNLSGMSQWLSDSFCRLSTGGGFAVRAHYSDADEIIFDAKRPVILNGIEDIAQKTDLADRSISVTLDHMKEDTRLEEGVMWAEFDRMTPGILGAVFDAVSESLKNLNKTVLTEKNVRMLDFAKWIIAAEPVLPFESGFFMKAYAGNRASLVESTLQNDIVADTILQFMEKREFEEWKGTASELLTELRNITVEGLPKKPNGFSGHLRRVLPFLREVGIRVTIPQSKERLDGRVVRVICITQFKTSITFTTKNNKFIGNIGNTSDCQNGNYEKTDSSDVADSVAYPPCVADKDRQQKKDRQHSPIVLPIKESGIADAEKTSAIEITESNQNVCRCADVADKSPLLYGEVCLKCENRDPVHSNFCQWNKGGLIISWEKCQGQFFRQSADKR